MFLFTLQIWAWMRITTLMPIQIRTRISMDEIIIDEDRHLPDPPVGARYNQHNIFFLHNKYYVLFFLYSVNIIIKCRWIQYHSFTRTTSHSVRIARDILDRMDDNQVCGIFNLYSNGPFGSKI